eukprot:6415259-Amphidinium_carterae.1
MFVLLVHAQAWQILPQHWQRFPSGGKCNDCCTREMRGNQLGKAGVTCLARTSPHILVFLISSLAQVLVSWRLCNGMVRCVDCSTERQHICAMTSRAFVRQPMVSHKNLGLAARTSLVSGFLKFVQFSFRSCCGYIGQAALRFCFSSV